jgi:hypothetical protein
MTLVNYVLSRASTHNMAGILRCRSSVIQRCTLIHNKHKATTQGKIDKVKVKGNGDVINDQKYKLMLSTFYFIAF